MTDPPLEQGWVASELAQEFPELGLRYVALGAGPVRSPAPVRRRLRRLADRVTGGHVIHMRQDTVPWAYRVFWRQVGIDPDRDRTPVERLAVERLRRGGLASANLIEDAVAIATLETGVAVQAFDADRLEGPLGMRLSEPEELLGGSGPALTGRRIVIADGRCPLAVLGGDPAPDRAVGRGTTRTAIAAVHVKGVPRISVEEALWIVAELVSGEG